MVRVVWRAIRAELVKAAQAKARTA
jgi:hypothetical protein